MVANQPPEVLAGGDRAVTAGVQILLQGTALDDGLPNPPGSLTYAWTQLSGPELATLGTPAALETTASFPATGTYVLRLTVSDSQYSVSDDLVINALGSALVVVGTPSSLSVGENYLVSRIEALGYSAEIMDDDVVDEADSNGRAFVWITSSVSTETPPEPGGLSATEFLTTAVPVVVQGTGIVDDMKMTSGAARGILPAQSMASVGAVGHPLAAGHTGVVTLSAVSAYAWGGPSSPAVAKVLTTSDASKAFVFAYEQGAALEDTTPAPERRVFFGVGLGDLTEDGQEILDATLLWLGRQNAVPHADAGSDQYLVLGGSSAVAPLNGLVSDDGQPNPPGALSVAWTQLSGPSTATIANPATASTTVTVVETGNYQYRLSVDDSSASASDTVNVTVVAPGANTPPVVYAGPDEDLALPGSITLEGSVSDDGFPSPPGALVLTWSKVSGPGTVTFGAPAAVTTTATFSDGGTYVLRLTADDGLLQSSDDVLVNAQQTALLVVGDLSLSAGDQVLKERMEALGFAVETVGPPVTIGDTNEKAFVWISDSYDHNSIEAPVVAHFKTTDVPVALHNTPIAPELGYANLRSQVPNQTEASVASPHPVSAGYSGTLTLNVTAAYHYGGQPHPAATHVMAMAAGPTYATIFTYETGATMVDTSPAPERRLFFGLSGVALASITNTGRDVLDAAIAWLGHRNTAPWPDAGPEGAGTLTGPDVTVPLAGTVVDDGLPNPPGAVSVAWSRDGGPEGVTFSSPNSLTTDATFSAAGTYYLRLTASDGAAARSDLTVVEIGTTSVTNAPPSVSAGPDLEVPMTGVATLSATAADDGYPSPGTLSYTWTLVNGPGAAAFGNASAPSTTVSFPSPGSVPGLHVFRVTVSDGLLSASDDVEVRVGPARKALYSVQPASVLIPHPDDQVVLDRLEKLGYAIDVVADNAQADPDEYDLVVIGAISNSEALRQTGVGYPTTPTPVLCLEALFWDFNGVAGPGMRMAVPQQGVTTHMVEIKDGSHPMAAGLSGSVTFFDSGVANTVGVPTSSASVIASRSDAPGQAVVFAYAEGALMQGGVPAPGRRVGFAQNGEHYTGAALAMLDAALEWLTQPRAPALLVTGSTTPTTNDRALQERLVVRGYPTTMVAAASVTASDADGKAVVVIANYSGSEQPATAFHDAAVPVVVGNPGLLPWFYMTGAGYGAVAGQTQISILDPSHPLAASLSGNLSVSSVGDYFGWGAPSSEADAVASIVGDVEKLTIFGYEAGRTMTGSVVAAERRASLWLGPGSALFLTPDGAALVHSALDWAVESDGDRDGLGYADEIRWGADPTNPDTNGDGLLDGASVRVGIPPAEMDVDSDGLENPAELLLGTDPFLYDTDGDGVGDAADCFPLDPDRDACPTPTSGDMTPPDITLVEPPPSAATLISSTTNP